MKIISALFLLIILGCSEATTDPQFSSDSSTAEMDMSIDEETSDESASPATEVVQEQKIIKTARLAFETKDVETNHKRILQLASQYNGLIQSDASHKDYNRNYKNLVVRIPTENFQQFLNGISEGVAYFDQRNISQQDVSEEFIDLEARLRAKRELESRYLELLKKANNVKEMLEIEQELSNIREEIESKQGRLQFLQNQVSMSTVYIEFYKITAETGVTQSYGQKMKNALQGGWNGISVIFIGILYLWPLFVVTLILIFVIRILLARRKNKIKKI